MEKELIELLEKKRSELREELAYGGEPSAKKMNALNAVDGLLYALKGNDW